MRFGNLAISTLTVNVIRYGRISFQYDSMIPPMQPQWCPCYSCHMFSLHMVYCLRSILYVWGLPTCPFTLGMGGGLSQFKEFHSYSSVTTIVYTE